MLVETDASTSGLRSKHKGALLTPLRRLLGETGPHPPWDDSAPIRADLFSVERLQEHARSLAAAQGVMAGDGRAPHWRNDLPKTKRCCFQPIAISRRPLTRADAAGSKPPAGRSPDALLRTRPDRRRRNPRLGPGSGLRLRPPPSQPARHRVRTRRPDQDLPADRPDRDRRLQPPRVGPPVAAGRRRRRTARAGRDPAAASATGRGGADRRHPRRHRGPGELRALRLRPVRAVLDQHHPGAGPSSRSRSTRRGSAPIRSTSTCSTPAAAGSSPAPRRSTSARACPTSGSARSP